MRSGEVTRVRSILALALLFLSPVSTRAAVVGATDGTLTVNPDGSAGYSIPIVVPPSPYGLAPLLTLAYRSGAGNGIAGVGWSVNGLSRIERCPATIELDGFSGAINFDADDKLCMDGERLLPFGTYDGGKQYRTERESGARIVGYGGVGANPAARFEVWTKDGRHLVYGDSGGRPDAQADTTPPAPAAIRFWALAHVENAAGVMDIRYLKNSNTGEHLPEHIWYSGRNSPTGNSVHFIYGTNRPDQSDLFVGGTRVPVARRLGAIQSFTPGIPYGEPLPDGQSVRTYRLWYTRSPATGRSLLQSVEECASGMTECLPPTVFTYAQTDSWDPHFNSTSLNAGLFSAYYDNLDEAGQTLRQADVNGDGHGDYVFGPFLENGDAQLRWAAALGGATGSTPTFGDSTELVNLRGWRYGAQTVDVYGHLVLIRN